MMQAGGVYLRTSQASHSCRITEVIDYRGADTVGGRGTPGYKVIYLLYTSKYAYASISLNVLKRPE